MWFVKSEKDPIVCEYGKYNKVILKNVDNLEKLENFFKYKFYCGGDLNNFDELVTQSRIELQNYTDIKFPEILFNYENEIYELKISNSKIQSITEDNLMFANKLTYLYLQNNEIMEVNGLSNLKLFAIDLSHNKIKNIDNFSFNQSKSMVWCDLSSNELENFDQTILMPLKSAAINLEFNKISNIKILDQSEFLPTIESLNLANNLLTKIKINQIAINLNFTHNKITEITCEENVDKIEILDLSYNEIKADEGFYHCMKNLKGLRSLNLSHNDMTLQELKIDTFSEMKELTELSLSNLKWFNRNSINYGLFSKQRSLKFLDLSYNRIRSFELFALSSLTSLNTLDLSGNDFDIPQEFKNIKSVLPYIKNIGISDSKFTCKCLSLLIVYLRSNGIELMDIKSPVNHLLNVNEIPCKNTYAGACLNNFL